jgi:hypothetical protein
MSRTYWNRLVPHSMVKALNLTKDHGKEKKQQSVQRIGDRLGVSPDCLYKWLGDATMPVNKVIAFEESCGINFVTQYLAQSQGFLLVPAPTGRKAEHKDLNELQLYMAKVVAKIIEANQGECTAQEAIDGIKVLMQDLAYQQRNVKVAEMPQEEFDLFKEGAK